MNVPMDFTNPIPWKMDSLREAAEKIKKSPKIVRKKINYALKKEKLTEDWIHNREQVELGVVFNVKILGRKDATEPKGKGCTDKTTEELIQKSKSNSKTEKLQKVSMMIDCDKVVIRDLLTHDLVEEIPVKRICFCTADPNYPKVLAFLVEAEGDEKAYIYAMLTNKKAMADAIALTIAQAYTMSFEDEEECKNGYKQDACKTETKIHEIALAVPTFSPPSNDLSDDDDDGFLMLAQSRKKLDIGTVSKDDFTSNISDFLAVNNTLKDLEHSKSTDDLFSSPRHRANEHSPRSEPQVENLIQF